MPRRLLLLFLLLASSLPASCLPAFCEAAAFPALDLLPLKRALTPLNGDGILQSHSTIRMTGSRAGVSVTLREDLQILSRRPGRFHASLTQYDAQGGPQKKLVVVSNGVSVWTYRPGLRQYSVMPLTAFKKADADIPTLGLVIGGFYLGGGRPLVEGFHSITGGNSADVLAVLSAMDVTLSRQIKSVGGEDDYVYRLVMTKENMTYQFYVSSQTSLLTRVDLTGTQDGIRFTYREDIVKIAPRPAVPALTFQFVPPPGTAEVNAVRYHKPLYHKPLSASSRKPLP